MDTNYRLHLATRIHFIMLREFGRGIDVELMLERDLYAIDVINVCRAVDNDELSRLGELFIEASHSPEFAWSPTTRFGNTVHPANLHVDIAFETATSTEASGWRQFVHSLLRRNSSAPSVT